ncbi:MAG: L,D-transpeptidase family protein [Hyphomicrobium sp.]
MRKANLFVRRLSARDTRGWLQLGTLGWPCALGRGGIRGLKREGDGATPRGSHRVAGVYYRPDKFRRLPSSLPLIAMRPDLGWCDTPGDANYNREVRHPYPAGAERLWRSDDLYDAVVVLNYNVRPRIKGRGSAIFLHIARPGFAPTEGCVALRKRDLRILLSRVRRGTSLIIA